MKNPKRKKIALVGGGTAGHVLPVLAVADALRAIDPKIDLLYFGSLKGSDRQLVAGQKLKFIALPAGKWRRYWDWRNLTDPFLVLLGLFVALRHLISYRPDVVFVKGGSLGVPVGLAARLLQIPLILHESDIPLGAANRWLAPLAQKIAVSFPVDNYHSLPPAIRRKLIYTGLPMRSIRTAPQSRKPATIFITGGSQGARQINNLISEILPELVKQFRLLHLTGRLDFGELKARQRSLGGLAHRYQPQPFIKNFTQAVQAADLVISRAGATTLFELAAAGRPAVLIPLSSSANNHQYRNAKYFARRGAALLLKEPTPRALLKTIQRLFAHPRELSSLSQRIRTLDRPGAAERIARILLQVSL